MLQRTADAKQLEESLFESVGFIRSLVESSTDCIKVLDFEGRLQYMSRGGQALLGIENIDTYLNVGYEDFWEGSDHQAAVEAIRSAQIGLFGRFQGYCPTVNGTPKWWDVSISPITDSAGKVKSLLAISRDVTERKLAEDELKKAREQLEQRVHERTVELAQANEQLKMEIEERKLTEKALRKSERKLRRLSSQLLTAQEDERGRIARELHDGIGQSLGTVKVKAETIIKEATSSGAKLNVELLTSVIATVQRSMEEIRIISMDLWPPTLDSLGILATIGWFCREFQTAYPHICIEKQIEIQEDEVPETHKIVIYRILQESFNNIAKHSAADLLSIHLGKREGSMTLAIHDNGRGFNPEKVFYGESCVVGLGLASMRERTESSGGSFSIMSSLGQGTLVRAIWKI